MGVWSPRPHPTSGDDTFIGGEGDEVANGAAGDDYLNGGAGNDALEGGAGNDTIVAGPGVDTVNGGSGNDFFLPNSVSSGYDQSQYDGGDGIDTFDYSVAASSLSFSSAGGDTITVADNELRSIEVLVGGTGNDIFFGSITATMFGGAGGDSIFRAPAGTRTVHGGVGDDYVEISAGDQVYGDEQNDTFFASGAFNIVPPLGVIDGGDGLDTLQTYIAFDIDLVSNSATSGNAQYDIFGIEVILGYGRSGAYSTRAKGDANNNDFSVNPLFDDSTGQVYYDGRGGNDTLSGSLGNETLVGGTGDDFIRGSGGNDTLDGGGGTDTIDWSDETTAIVLTLTHDGTGSIARPGIGTDNFTSFEGVRGGAGNDRLTSNMKPNRLEGGGGSDSLAAAEGNDTLNGGTGADTLKGGTGTDAMTGGIGNDVFYVDNTGDKTIEAVGGGIDTVYSTISRTLSAEIENLRLQGSEGLTGNGNALNNKIFGNTGANKLQGFDGNDTIDGKDGNDTLVDGAGNDTLAGGQGADVFRFAKTLAGADTINDFNKNADRFDLSGGSFSALKVVPDGDVILTHNGGTIRICAPLHTLTLAQYNALVLPATTSTDGDRLSDEGHPIHGWQSGWLPAVTAGLFVHSSVFYGVVDFF